MDPTEADSLTAAIEHSVSGHLSSSPLVRDVRRLIDGAAWVRGRLQTGIAGLGDDEFDWLVDALIDVADTLFQFISVVDNDLQRRREQVRASGDRSALSRLDGAMTEIEVAKQAAITSGHLIGHARRYLATQDSGCE